MTPRSPRGRSPRDGIDLMIAHGLTTRRGGATVSTPRPRRRPASTPPTNGDPRTRARDGLAADDHQLADAAARLAALSWPPRVLREPQRRFWSRATLLELGCGWERGRVLVPIRDGAGDLRGLLRYAPRRDHAPKMLAARGTRLGLIPHPGIRDGAGRDTARRIVGDLKRVGVSGSMVDLARGRSDGYDLSDWLHDRASRDRRELARALGAPRPSGASDRAQR